MKTPILDSDSCRKDLAFAEWQAPDEFVLERSIFLGTIFSLYPSGKYYTPFACSNLEPCEACSGEGTVPNPKADPAAHYSHRQARSKMTQEAMQAYGAHCDGNWPQDVVDEARRLDELVRAVERKLECTVCGGLGSEEAYLDTLFAEQLEEEADKLDAYITSGEGDPCDIFLAQGIDMPDDPCPHCESDNTAWLKNCTMKCSDCDKEFEFKEISNADNS